MAKRGRTGRPAGAIGWTVVCLVLAVACGVAAASTIGAWRASRMPPPVERGKIQVEVLNGCGQKGIAQRVARTMVALGFDVVRSGNADRFDHAHTVVIDRSGREGRAREVAAALGMTSTIEELRPEAFLDVTLVIGADFDSLKVGK